MPRIKQKRKPLSEPDTYHHGDLKKTLLETALRLLKNKSPKEISLRELAREAGVSQAAPYRHFKNKDELIAELMREGFELKLKYMKESIELNKGDILKTYLGCGLAYFRMGKKHPQHFKLMFGSNVTPNSDYPELEVAACSTFAHLKAMIVECQKAKLIGAGDPYQKALHCWTLVHGFTILFVEDRYSWLGITKENSENALLILMSQFLNGDKSALEPSDSFALFETKESRENREFMEGLGK